MEKSFHRLVDLTISEAIMVSIGDSWLGSEFCDLILGWTSDVKDSAPQRK